MSFIPRNYQAEENETLWQAIHANPTLNPVQVLPTGSGKSLCMGMFIWRVVASYNHVRVLSVTHDQRLIEGNHKTLKKLWPAAPAGIYSAGLGIKDARHQITFCGIQSVAKRAATFGHIDFMIVDEADRISPNAATQYQKFINDLKKVNPNMLVIGYTATPFRQKGGMLVEDEDSLFDYTPFDISSGDAFLRMIDEGYLIRPIPYKPKIQVDESSVKVQGGEYKDADANEAFEDQGILEMAVQELIEVADLEGRQSMLTFCQSIEHAELVAEMFQQQGRSVEAVHSKKSNNDEILAAHRAGEIWGITNRDILTVGYDDPRIDLMGILRLTRSPRLWVQILGRGTRPCFVNGYYPSQFPGELAPDGWFDLETIEGRLGSIAASHKRDCRVLDFAGNTSRLGPINYPIIPKKRKKGVGGEAPIRTCPVCEAQHHTSVKVCNAPSLSVNESEDGTCGYVFPEPKRFEDQASQQDLVSVIDLSSMPEPDPRVEEVLPVHEMVCEYHAAKEPKKGPKKPDTMRVRYRSGFQSFSTWVCFAHPQKTFPRRKAEQWWKEHGGQGPAPTDIEEALELIDNLEKPEFIKVWTNTKFPEILDYDFMGTGFEINLNGAPVKKEKAPDPMPSNFYQTQSDQGYYDDDIPF